jgi:hypothetical protein
MFFENKVCYIFSENRKDLCVVALVDTKSYLQPKSMPISALMPKMVRYTHSN